ncbi:MAG: hypothetical protein HY823_02185 [Acidobacteria bacterium]|nr:hypothetical protein [Acidobacteriota bacterium]
MFASRLALVLAAAALAPAQEPIYLDQSLQVNLNRWQSEQNPAFSQSQALYQFSAGFPLITYRLGALSFNGGLEYLRRSYGEQSEGKVGLNRIGIGGTLFPYRRFQLKFDYSVSQIPSLLGAERVRSGVGGALLRYRNGVVQDLRVEYRQGRTSQGEQSDRWTQWTLGGRQRFGLTETTFNYLDQGYRFAGASDTWHLRSLLLEAITRQNGTWEWRNQIFAEDYSGGSRQVRFTSHYTWRKGPWVHLSDAVVTEAITSGPKTHVVQVAQSSSYSKGPFQTFATVTAAGLNTTGAETGRSGRAGSFMAGSAYNLGREWRVMGDMAFTSVSGDYLGPQDRGSLTTVHAGISAGGDLPAALRRTFYFLSDMAFERRIRDQYPPGYLPPELEAERIQRRIHQAGGLKFSADYSRTTPRKGGGFLDWARVMGEMRVNGNLRLLAIGDRRNDNEFSRVGTRLDERGLSLTTIWTLGVSSLQGTWGFNKADLRNAAGTPAGSSLLVINRDNSFALADANVDHRYHGVSFNSRIWKIPFGASTNYVEDALGQPSRANAYHMSLDFRQITLRIQYQRARRHDGFTTSFFSLDLVRFFDTTPMWFGKP